MSHHSYGDKAIDYYKVLEVSPTASLREITAAYRSLALKYHPDKNQGDEYIENFHLLKSAYDILSNEESRKAFDEKLAAINARSAQEASLSLERRNLHETLLQKERDARRRKEEMAAAETKRVKELELQRKAYMRNLQNNSVNESFNTSFQDMLRRKSGTSKKMGIDTETASLDDEVSVEELTELEERVFSRLRELNKAKADAS